MLMAKLLSNDDKVLMKIASRRRSDLKVTSARNKRKTQRRWLELGGEGEIFHSKLYREHVKSATFKKEQEKQGGILGTKHPPSLLKAGA